MIKPHPFHFDVASASVNRAPSGQVKSILARIDGGTSELKYKRDQIAYSQGDRSDCVFYVESGRVKVTVLSEQGKEAVVAILPPGSFCGDECLTGHRLRISTVKTLTECVLIRMAKASIIRALHDDPEFSSCSLCI